jgi:hypothetical protein
VNKILQKEEYFDSVIEGTTPNWNHEEIKKKLQKKKFQ